MATLGTLFSSDQGNGFQASGTNIVAPATQNEASNLYTQSQTALGDQSAFLNALGAQNGIQNQSNVYNQLQGIANGTGPNPAQAMLSQQTGQNVAAQSALMAGQRGTGANAGLLARQAAQQGAATQQQAVGQGASMQANQALNAINSAGNIANNQVGNQANTLNSFNSNTQNEQQNLLNSIAQTNNASVGMQSNQNSNNAAIANTNAQAQNKMIGQGIGAVGSIAGLAEGGKVADAPKFQRMADGGVAGPQSFVGQALRSNLPSNQSAGGPNAQGGTGMTSDSYLQGSFEGNQGGGGQSSPLAQLSGSDASSGGMGAISDMISGGGAAMMAARGGKVPAMLSPGEKYLSPKEAKAVADKKASPDQVGKMVPGQAKVKGDSLKNDVVPAKLDPGGVVLPRHVMNSKDPAHEAYKFVAAIQAKSDRKTKARK